MQAILSWLGANWLLVAAIAAVLVFVANAITKHWSGQTGLVKALTFVTEILSPLASKDVPGVFKLPLTSKPPDAVRKLPPLPVLLALVAALGASGCATWQQTTKTSLDAASAAAETAHVAVRTHFDAKCEAIARDCARAKLPTCPSLVSCQEERHKPIVALSGIQAACLVGYSAIVIADKGTALQKAAEVARLVGDLLAALKLVGVKL